ncbi:MAG: response regulator [Melioribacteraceae bacterium]|nr:response regulator [Melioribacteraceae bacterium]
MSNLVKILFVVFFVFIAFLIEEYVSLYNDIKWEKKESLTRQVQLFSNEIENKLEEFTELLDYSFSNEKVNNLFINYNNFLEDESAIFIRRFYFKHQILISRIKICNSSKTIIIEKDVNNYFSFNKTEMANDIDYTTFGIIGNDSEFSYKKIITNKFGDKSGIVEVELNLEKFILNDFNSFYIGPDAWFWLVDKNNNVTDVYYTKGSFNYQKNEFQNSNLISKDVTDGLSGFIEHNLVNSDGDNIVIYSAYSPLAITNNNYGVVFTISAESLFSSLNSHSFTISILFAMALIIIVVLFGRHIKSIRKMTDKLSKSEDKFRSIFESFVDVYFRTDLEGVIQIVSPSADELTGWNSEELIGQNVNQIYENENARTHFLNELKNKKFVNDYELNLYKKNREVTPVSVTAHLIFDKNKNIVGIEGTLRNIAERKKTELELRKAKEEAEIANNAKSEFIANISHELKTPLNAIIGFSQIYKDETSINASLRNIFVTIEDSGLILLNLINNLIDVTQISSGKLKIIKKEFNITEVIDEISETIKNSVLEKNIEFKLNIKNEVPEFIIGDEKRLKQILMNLLKNAVKYTKEGSITFELEYANGEFHFAVIDTGIGINSERINKIFNPFFQSTNFKKQDEGIGLGLSISKAIAEQMGGEILLESSPGKGSKFSFNVKLDISCRKNIAENENPYQDKNSAERKTILIADDQKENRFLLKEILKRLGFDVISAKDGIEAFEKTKTNKVDLIIMDHLMPECDGIESTKMIKKIFPELPIILFTGNDIEDKLDIKFDDYMLKPVNSKKVYSSISKLLNLNPNKNSSTLDVKNTVDFVYPPKIDLLALLSSVKTRNITEFNVKLNILEAENPECKLFIDKLKELQNSFKLGLLEDTINSVLEQK